MLARVLPTHLPGGMQDHTAALARGVAAAGHAVIVVTTRLPAGAARQEIPGVQVVYVEGAPPVRFTDAWRRESVRSLRSLHADRGFDVVHAQGSGGTGFLAQGWAQRLGVGGVLSLHGTAWDEIRTAWRLLVHGRSTRDRVTALPKAAKQVVEHLAFTAPAARRANVVIATSDEQAALIPRLCGVPAARVQTVYNGIDVAQFRPAERPMLVGREAVGIVVARLIAEKGVQFAIEALRQIRAAGTRVRLVVVGDGEYAPELRRQVERLDLGASIEFRGSVPPTRLHQEYQAADLFLNPTIRANGYDLTILQAQACGLPVVVSRIGSTPTVVREGTTGLLVPPGDARALAGAIRRILEDEPLRRRLAGEGRRGVEDRFSETRMVCDTIAAYAAAAREVGRSAA